MATEQLKNVKYFARIDLNSIIFCRGADVNEYLFQLTFTRITERPERKPRQSYQNHPSF